MTESLPISDENSDKESAENSNNQTNSKLVIFLLSLFPILNWIKIVTPQTIRADMIAGISSAIFALPQGIAFALIAGLPPEFGLYASIIAPIIAAIFGSSWNNVSGPTVATSIVIIGIINSYAVPQSPQYIGFVLILTLLAGIIQLLLGLFRMGHIVNFISHTVVIGFSTGAALLIMANQITNFFGLSIERQPNIALQLKETFYNMGDANYSVLVLSILTLASAILFQKNFKKLPYLLMAMITGAVLAFILQFIIDDEIKMVGAIPQGLPSFVFPNLDLNTTKQLFASAIAIATLGLIQTSSIAKMLSAKTGQKTDSNQEFIGQGLINIIGSFFSCFFSSSSFGRSAINYASGAITPMSSLFASGLIILVLLFASHITEYLPTPAMSAIIMLVGWRLIDFDYIKKVIKTSKSETATFFVTLLSTLFLSLEFAIYSGVILSLILYLQKTSHPKVVDLTADKFDPYRRLVEITSDKQKECPQLNILRIDGSLFFGAIEHTQKKITKYTNKKQHSILLICDGITLVDISGAEMLVNLKKSLQKKGGDLYLSGLKQEARAYLVNSPYWEELGASRNIYNYSLEAIGYIFNNLNHKKCAECSKRVFVECDQIEMIKKKN